MNWIPLGYIFETKLIHMLVFNFLPVPLFRNVTLKCLTEIAGVTVPNYADVFMNLFTQTMAQLESMLPMSTDIRAGYAIGGDQEQNFIQNLAMFLCTFLKEHGTLAESNVPTLKNALHYLVQISRVEEVEIFKICLEYWNAVLADLYREVPFASAQILVASSRRTALWSEVRRHRTLPAYMFFVILLLSSEGT